MSKVTNIERPPKNNQYDPQNKYPAKKKKKAKTIQGKEKSISTTMSFS